MSTAKNSYQNKVVTIQIKCFQRKPCFENPVADLVFHETLSEYSLENRSNCLFWDLEVLYLYYSD